MPAYYELRNYKYQVFELTAKGKLRQVKDPWGNVRFGAYDSKAAAWEHVTSAAEDLPGRTLVVLPTRQVVLNVP